MENKDYEYFLNPQNSPPLSSPKSNLKTNLKVIQKIENELVGSPLKLKLAVFTFSVLGYLANLSICAQGELGITNLSHQIFNIVHSNLPTCSCALITGSSLTGIPFVLSFFFLNKFQQRYLLKFMSWYLILIPFLATALIFLWTWHPIEPKPSMLVWGKFDVPNALTHAIVWTSSALFTPYFLISFFRIFTRQKKAK